MDQEDGGMEFAPAQVIIASSRTPLHCHRLPAMASTGQPPDEQENKSVYYSTADTAKVTINSIDADNGNNQSTHVKEESVHAKLIKKRTLLLNKLNAIENSKYFARRYAPLPQIRPKSHWDHVLDEVQWLALDFRQELRYKHAYCQAVAGACVEYKQAKEYRRSILQNDCALTAARSTAKAFSSHLQQVANECHNGAVVINSIVDVDADAAASSISAAIEKILSLPSTAVPTPAVIPTPTPTHGSYSRHKHASLSSLLLPHQQAVVTQFAQLSAAGFGTMAFGKAFTGKTVTVLHHSLSWIPKVSRSRANSSAMDVDGQPSILESKHFLVVFAAQKALPKWLSAVKQHYQDECCVLLWAEGRDLAAEATFDQSKKLLVLVCLEHIELFSRTVRNNHSVQAHFKGWIVDVRATITLSEPGTKGLVQVEIMEKTRCKEHLISLANHFSSLKCPRLLVSDASLLALDRIAVLSVLIPGTTYEAIMAKLHENLQETQINLSKALVNLSIHVAMPSESVALANAQIREEIVSVDLTAVQQMKYDEISSALVKSSYYDGSDIDQLARITALLKMVCFHEGFASMKRIAHLKPSQENYPMPRAFWSYKPSYSMKAESKDKQIKSGVCFYSGKLVNFINKSSTKAYEEDLAAGSSKLELLRSLLMQRFNGLRVVVTASTWAELVVIHRYLCSLDISHMFPHLQLGKQKQKSGLAEDQLMENLMWLEEEKNVQMFNNDTVLSNILLATNQVFKSPCSSPWLADAVIVLGHDFEQVPDFRSCFRLRLLRAGPSGDPVTIVKVCAKKTLEEVVLRQKTTLYRLRGSRLSDLHFNIRDPCYYDTSTSLANFFFLKKAPSARSLVDEESSVASNMTAYIERVSTPASLGGSCQDLDGEEPRRGGGKGTIVTGPQGKTTFIKQSDVSSTSSTASTVWVANKPPMLQINSIEEVPAAKLPTPDNAGDADWASSYSKAFKAAVAELSLCSDGCEVNKVKISSSDQDSVRQTVANAMLTCMHKVLWSVSNDQSVRRMACWAIIWKLAAIKVDAKPCPLTCIERMRLRVAGFGLLPSEERLNRLLCIEQCPGAVDRANAEEEVPAVAATVHTLSSAPVVSGMPAVVILQPIPVRPPTVLPAPAPAAAPVESVAAESTAAVPAPVVSDSIAKEPNPCTPPMTPVDAPRALSPLKKEPHRLIHPSGRLDLSAYIRAPKEVPVTSSSVITVPSYGTVTSQLFCPSPNRAAVFQVFRDTLTEMHRMGVRMDPYMHVNPLQVATRYDIVSYPPSSSQLIRDDTVCIKYISKPPAGATKAAPKRKAKADEVTSPDKDDEDDAKRSRHDDHAHPAHGSEGMPMHGMQAVSMVRAYSEGGPTHLSIMPPVPYAMQQDSAWAPSPGMAMTSSGPAPLRILIPEGGQSMGMGMHQQQAMHAQSMMPSAQPGLLLSNGHGHSGMPASNLGGVYANTVNNMQHARTGIYYGMLPHPLLDWG